MSLASSWRLGSSPLAYFRFGRSKMTEPGASPEDPWVKASSADAHTGEGRAGRARARRGSGRRGAPQLSPESPLLSGPRGCREDSSHPACAKVGRQTGRVCGNEGLMAGRWDGTVGSVQRGRHPHGLARPWLNHSVVLAPVVRAFTDCTCLPRGKGLTGFSLLGAAGGVCLQ